MIFGGFTEGTRVNSIKQAQLNLPNTVAYQTLHNGSGSSASALPIQRNAHTAVANGNSVFVFGGQDEDNNKLGDLWEFNLTTKQWAKISSFSGQEFARSGHTAVSTTPQAIEKFEKTPVDDDADHARETLRTLIDKGNEAIDGILHIAKNSDHPRAYEVAGQLIKTVSDTAKDLLEVQKRKKDLEKEDKPKIQTQNNLFVGSTHELLKAMKQAQQPEQIESGND